MSLLRWRLAIARPLPSAESVLSLRGARRLQANRAVRLPNGISLSPGFMLMHGGDRRLRRTRCVLGAALVGALSVLRIQHFKRGLWPWLPFNAGITSLACVARRVLYGAMPASLPVLRCRCLRQWPSLPCPGPCSWFSTRSKRPPFPRALVLELGRACCMRFRSRCWAVLVGRLYLNARPARDAPDHRADPHRSGDVRLVHEGPGVPRRDRRRCSFARSRQKDRYTAGHVGTRCRIRRSTWVKSCTSGPARMERLRFAALDARHRQARRAQPSVEQARASSPRTSSPASRRTRRCRCRC